MKTVISVFCRSGANRNGEYGVSVRVQHGRLKLDVSTGITVSERFHGLSVPKKEWNSTAKGKRLLRTVAALDEYLMANPRMPEGELRKNIRLIVTGKTPAEKVLADCVDEYAGRLADHTAGIYRLTVRKIREYDARADFFSADEDWLAGFRSFYGEMSDNGIAIHLRNIRTVFNWARRKKLTDRYPFYYYKIKEERIPPNNLTVDELRKLRDYPVEPWQEVYRDIFMLSFYLAGVNVGDLLLSPGLKDGRFVFRRQKTGQYVDLPVVPEARRIIEKYKGRDHLLSVMDGRADYHSFMRRWNIALKKIGTQEVVPDKIGKRRKIIYHPLFPDITTYTARYTFASIAANDLDISEVQIGRCLGHSWSKTVTARYIADDRSKVDMVVRRVAEYVNG